MKLGEWSHYLVGFKIRFSHKLRSSLDDEFLELIFRKFQQHFQEMDQLKPQDWSKTKMISVRFIER